MNISTALSRYLPRPVIVAREQSLYWPTMLSQSVVMRYSGSVCINGFQNSGTNWLCQLTSHYLDVPIFEAWHRWTPSLFGRYVLHTHRFLNTPAMNDRTIYIARDGRDTSVSRFLKAASSPRQSYLRQQIREEAGVDLNPEKVHEQLADFIEWDFTHKKKASVDWAQHIRRAMSLNLEMVTFEGLKSDPVDVLAPVLERLDGRPVDREKLAQVVEARKFENVAGKDNRFHKRKGATGEWRTLFDRRARDAFARYAQAELVMAGYEVDDAWVDTE